MFYVAQFTRESVLWELLLVVIMDAWISCLEVKLTALYSTEYLATYRLLIDCYPSSLYYVYDSTAIIITELYVVTFRILLKHNDDDDDDGDDDDDDDDEMKIQTK